MKRPGQTADRKRQHRENEIARRYLKQLTSIARNIDSIGDKLSRCCQSITTDTAAVKVSQANDADLAGLVAKRKELQHMLIVEKSRLEAEHIKRERQIEGMKELDYADILRRRYLPHQKWETIIQSLPGYSWAAMHREHARALNAFYHDYLEGDTDEGHS